MNGGAAKDALTEENAEAVRAGFANLKPSLKISVNLVFQQLLPLTNLWPDTVNRNAAFERTLCFLMFR